MTWILWCSAVGFTMSGTYAALSVFEQFRQFSREHIMTQQSWRAEWYLVLCCICWTGVALWSSRMMILLACLQRFSIPNSNWTHSDLNVSLSVCLPLALCLIGTISCSINKVFVKDDLDTVDEFIKQAQSMSIQEIRKLKHKDVLLTESLFHGLSWVIGGGLCVSAGIISLEYFSAVVILPTSSAYRLSWDGGMVVGSVISSLSCGFLLVWILFRVLSLYHIFESLRLFATVSISILVLVSHVVSAYSFDWSMVDNSHDPQLSTTATSTSSSSSLQMFNEDQFIDIVVSVGVSLVVGTFMIVLSEMRSNYTHISELMAEADAKLADAVRKNTPSSKAHFVDQFSQMREPRSRTGSFLSMPAAANNNTNAQTKTSPGETDSDGAIAFVSPLKSPSSSRSQLLFSSQKSSSRISPLQSPMNSGKSQYRFNAMGYFPPSKSSGKNSKVVAESTPSECSELQPTSIHHAELSDSVQSKTLLQAALSKLPFMISESSDESRSVSASFQAAQTQFFDLEATAMLDQPQRLKPSAIKHTVSLESTQSTSASSASKGRSIAHTISTGSASAASSSSSSFYSQRDQTGLLRSISTESIGSSYIPLTVHIQGSDGSLAGDINFTALPIEDDVGDVDIEANIVSEDTLQFSGHRRARTYSAELNDSQNAAPAKYAKTQTQCQFPSQSQSQSPSSSSRSASSSRSLSGESIIMSMRSISMVSRLMPSWMRKRYRGSVFLAPETVECDDSNWAHVDRFSDGNTGAPHINRVGMYEGGPHLEEMTESQERGQSEMRDVGTGGRDAERGLQSAPVVSRQPRVLPRLMRTPSTEAGRHRVTEAEENVVTSSAQPHNHGVMAETDPMDDELGSTPYSNSFVQYQMFLQASKLAALPRIEEGLASDEGMWDERS